jgi:hypothetical protein
MKQTISESDFINAFVVMDRKENFTYEGRKALYEYFTQYEEETGEEIELDVIAICCEYNEEHLSDIMKNYTDVESLDDLRDKTTVVWVDDEDREDPLVIYQAY